MFFHSFNKIRQLFKIIITSVTVIIINFRIGNIKKR